MIEYGLKNTSFTENSAILFGFGHDRLTGVARASTKICGPRVVPSSQSG
jgi:hypothetical protein